MKSIVNSLILLFATSFCPMILLGQVEATCLFDDNSSSIPTSRDVICENQSVDFSAKYNNLDFHVDNFSKLPQIVIPINIMVWQKNDGSGNWHENNDNLDRFDQIMAWLNSKFNSNCENSKPPNISVSDFNNTKIQFVLKEINFFQNDDMWEFGTQGTSIADGIVENALTNEGAEHLIEDLNIHITGGSYPASGRVNRFPQLGNTEVDQFIITYFNTPLPISDPNYLTADFVFAGHLAHELGHILDLRHTYSSSVCNQNSMDYLDDVFGVGSNVDCPFVASWECDFGNPNANCSNNLMGGTKDNCYLSPKQIAFMHRALSLKTCRKYVRCDLPSEVPLEVSSDELWDFDIQLYQDIVVKSGSTLSITCKVSLPDQAKIVVEPGGKLIVDGGLLTTFCDDLWQGIEVHGNYQLRQNTTNQGVVEIINSGTIEHARNGIRTIEKRNDGTLDWSKTGGIIRVNGGIFKDCKHGIEFMSYQNLTPNGNESSNVSYVFNGQFITTDDFLINQSPYAGITFYDVNGIRVRSSLFENQKTDLANIVNTNRGSGIISVDANYNVTSGYNWQTGVPIAGTENEFRNLYYGVMTYGGTGRSDVKINDNLFEECIYGVGLMGCNYGIIGRNQFNILEFNNDPLNPISFGVYTDGAYGFNIEGNDFDILGASTNVYPHAVNVRNSSNNTSSGKVYRNNIDNVYLGTQTIGNNSALRIDCNDYVKGGFSTVDINHNTGLLADQGDCGPFSIGFPVKNEFNGTCNNTSMSQIFKSPGAAPFFYNYQAGSLEPTCHNLGSYAQSCLITNDPNTCPATLANNAITIVDARISLWKSKLGGTKESLNTVREIIASGDRAELDLIIEGESNGLSKDSLLAASPYLSDRILIEYLTQPNTPPNGHIQQVLLANSPLTDTVLSVLDGLNLPKGIKKQISQAQTGISERRLLEASESNLNTDRLVYIDAIVQEYLDTNWVDSAALFLREEGSVEALCALVPIEVRRKDTIRANSIIDTLRTVASEMESNYTNCKKACELNEFCNFQQFVFRIALRQGGYYSINQDERTVLEQVANSNARVAVNAKAILHFIDETLPMYKGKDLVFPKSMNSEDDVEKLLTQGKEEQEQLFTVHPNPTSGNTVFTIETEEMENLSIIITNFQGRVIKILDVTSNQVNYNLGPVADGTYLVHLVKGRTIQSTSKLIYAK